MNERDGVLLLLLLRVGADERVALDVLPERICLLVFTDVLLRDGDDDERVALVVLPERIWLLGLEFICPDVVLPLRDELFTWVADWLLVVRGDDVLTDLPLVEFAGCAERPRTADELP